MSSVSSTKPSPRAPRFTAAFDRLRSTTVNWPIAVVVGMVAFVARLAPVLAGGGLSGIGNYDDTVYFGSAVALVNAQVPYRDFLLLHPPGTVVALVPAALVARLTTEGLGLALARLSWMVMGSLSAVLVARLLRPAGRSASLIGGLAYALSFPAIYTELTTQLQGLQNFCLLAGLLLLRRVTESTRSTDVRRWRLLLLAGGVIGLGATAKIWGLVAVLLIAGWLVAQRRLRQAGVVTLGAALGTTLVCLPFFAVAPRRMWHQVVAAQVGRPADARLDARRVIDILGLHRVIAEPTAELLPLTAVVVLVGVLLAATTRLGRLAATLLVGLGGVLLVAPSWFPHYAALTAPALALLVGSSVGAISRWFAAAVTGRGSPRRRAWARAVPSAIAVLVVLAVAVPLLDFRFGQPFPSATFGAAVARTPGCVTSDSVVALLQMDVLGRNISRGCPTVVDLGGYSYAPAENGPVVLPRRLDPVWQAEAVTYLRSGRATVVVVYRKQLTPASRAAITDGRVLARRDGLKLTAPHHRPSSPSVGPR
ncbi:MAG: glycosyltransferase 87 family protein [Propionibacteriaceae bacterium]